MATAEQFQAQLAQQAQQIEELRLANVRHAQEAGDARQLQQQQQEELRRFQAQQQTQQTQADALGELVNLLKQGKGAAGSGGDQRSLIDTRGLGRPPTFDGRDERKAIAWLKKVRSFFIGVFAECEPPPVTASSRIIKHCRSESGRA